MGRGWSRFRLGELLPPKLPADLKENPCGLSETVEQWAEGRRGSTSDTGVVQLKAQLELAWDIGLGKLDN